MSTRLTTALPSLVFPHEIDTLTFSTATNDVPSEAVEVSIAIIADGSTAQTTVLTTTLTPDSYRLVRIYEVADLLTDYAADGGIYTILISSPSSTLIGSTTLIGCRARVRQPAVEWVARRPLSLLPSERVTALSQREYLTIYTSSEDAAKACRLKLTPSHPATGLTTKILVPTVRGRLAIFAWRWLNLYPTLVDLADDRFLIIAGVTGADMDIVPLTYRSQLLPYGAEEIAYVGAFGEWETMPFALVTRKDKPTRDMAVIGGRYSVLHVANATTWEGMSLPLPDTMLDAAADLLEAKKLIRTADDTPLVLTDGELEVSSSPDALPRLKATWREVTGTPRRGEATTHDIFDSTFDETYD